MNGSPSGAQLFEHMNKFFAAAVAAATALVACMPLFSQNSKPKTDAEGHELVSLWKDYRSAVESDRPQKQLEILESIRKEALSKKMLWDYYEAVRCRSVVRTSVNWKDREAAETDFNNDVLALDEPVVTFYHKSRSAYYGSWNQVLEYASANRAALEKGFHPQFHKSSLSFTRFGDIILPKLRNDWEYALWTLALKDGSSDFAGRAELYAYEKDNYPLYAIAEFLGISRRIGSDKQDALASYVKKYDGRAAALLARESLLSTEWYALRDRNSATSYDYKAFCEKCRRFEKDRKSFSGEEGGLADLCTGPASLIDEMEAEYVSIEASNGHAVIVVRNLESVNVNVVTAGDRPSSVFRTEVRNTVNSFYLQDTLTVDFKDFDDGDYTVEAKKGDTVFSCPYGKYSISLSVRRDASRWAFFAADHISGKPVDKVELRAKDGANGKMLGTAICSSRDGFTALPSDLEESLRGVKRVEFEARYTDSKGILHLSRGNHTYAYVPSAAAVRDICYAEILKDRSAFNPGETVHFKTIVYHGDRTVALRTVEEGRRIAAVLRDAGGKELSRLDLRTNLFGSADGEFLLQRGSRNGIYSIEVLDGSRVVASSNLRVDDFVLPTYELKFFPQDKCFFKGDVITVSGVAKSYSGHSLSDAVLEYGISHYGSDVSSGSIKLDRDGSFHIPVKADDSGSYSVTVKVTDVTGETLEFSRWYYAEYDINAGAVLLNAAEASISPSRSKSIVDGDEARISLRLVCSAGDNLTESAGGAVTAAWKLLDGNGATVACGDSKAGETVSVDMSSRPAGTYSFKTVFTARDSRGKEYRSDEQTIDLIKLGVGDDSLDADVENIFRVIPGDDVAFQIAATRGSVWACVEIFGAGGEPLRSSLVRLDGRRAEKGSVVALRYPFEEAWGNVVEVRVLYFRNSEAYSWTRRFERNFVPNLLPLSVESCCDETLPGRQYSVRFRTTPEAECAVAVFDKSTETIMSNLWHRVALLSPDFRTVSYATVPGSIRSDRPALMFDMETKAMGGRVLMKSSASVATNEAVCVEEACDDAAPAAQYASSDEAEVTVRENFANTLAFEPYLRSDACGVVEFNFSTSDKLSTYVLSAFAHDRSMNNATVRREFVVTIPVKVSLVQPQFLYEGDRYVLKAGLSSTTSSDAAGTLSLNVYDGSDYRESRPILSASQKASVPAGGAASAEFALDVPSGLKSGTAGIKLVFTSSDGRFSDAVFVTVPVLRPEQTITEAHSEVLLAGMDREALIDSLRALFVNVDASDAELREISILDMVKEAIPERISTENKDIISLSETYYARILAQSLGMEAVPADSTAALVSKILKCRNSDGGFAWFEGMSSSPTLTALVLKRLSSLRRRGLLPDDAFASSAPDAVRYLDKDQFSGTALRPFWCGGISMTRYLLVRSMWPEVDFKGTTDRKFRKEAREYLVPRKARGLNGYLLPKTERMMTLRNLSSSEAGIALAKSLGIRLMTKKRLASSLDADRVSLLEYAVQHRHGGIYYPNLVMPFRGLMESECYAHSLLCDLLADLGEKDIPEGMRLWLMLQKETQQWGENPEFIEALSTVLDASESTLATKVISLSKTFTKPFVDIKAAGNGFTVERSYTLLKADGTSALLAEGDEVSVGDKVRADYKIWNEENRSFVRLNAPRPASFRPVDQLSGRYGWWLSPLRVDGWYTFSPQGYRNVLAGSTEYWFDSYPEEKTTVSEYFFVTQKGRFTAPVVEIECLYAPHYRANGSYDGPFISR